MQMQNQNQNKKELRSNHETHMRESLSQSFITATGKTGDTGISLNVLSVVNTFTRSSIFKLLNSSFFKKFSSTLVTHRLETEWMTICWKAKITGLFLLD